MDKRHNKNAGTWTEVDDSDPLFRNGGLASVTGSSTVTKFFWTGPRKLEGFPMCQPHPTVTRPEK